MKEIVLVFGRLCSGKGTFCKPYIDDGYHHITTSDIVRRLSGESTRDKLQGTHDLDLAIGDEMVEVISDYDRIIIDGIRQVRIVEKILRAYTDSNLPNTIDDDTIVFGRFESLKRYSELTPTSN